MVPTLYCICQNNATYTVAVRTAVATQHLKTVMPALVAGEEKKR